MSSPDLAWDDQAVALPSETDLAFPPVTQWTRAWWLRACMVSTLDGSVVGLDGSSRSISSAADRDVFLRLRRDCDVILVGAGTVRAEDYSRIGVPIAVLSGRLDLSPDLRLFAPAVPAPRPLVITTRAAAASAPAWLVENAELVIAGDSAVDLDLALEQLAGRGLTRIHCEGGPRTLSDLANADLIDEFVLTITPELLGTPQRLLSSETSSRQWETRGTWTHNGTVVIRVRRMSSSPEGTH